jgi:hypothetical protein
LSATLLRSSPSECAPTAFRPGSTPAAALGKSGDTYRELIGEMLATSGYGIQR